MKYFPLLFSLLLLFSCVDSDNGSLEQITTETSEIDGYEVVELDSILYVEKIEDFYAYLKSTGYEIEGEIIDNDASKYTQSSIEYVTTWGYDIATTIPGRIGIKVRFSPSMAASVGLSSEVIYICDFLEALLYLTSSAGNEYTHVVANSPDCGYHPEQYYNRGYIMRASSWPYSNLELVTHIIHVSSDILGRPVNRNIPEDRLWNIGFRYGLIKN